MTDGVKYNWASIPDFNTLPTPKKEDKRSKKDSAQEQAAQEIRTRFHDGLASLYDIFNAGAPFNEKALLDEEKFEQISESKNISDIAKMAAEAFKDGMVLGNYFVKNHTALGCSFMSDFGDFCATCGRIVALAEQEAESISNNELHKDLRIEKGVDKKREMIQKILDIYFKAYKDKRLEDPKISPTKINEEFWLNLDSAQKKLIYKERSSSLNKDDILDKKKRRKKKKAAIARKVKRWQIKYGLNYEDRQNGNSVQ